MFSIDDIVGSSAGSWRKHFGFGGMCGYQRNTRRVQTYNCDDKLPLHKDDNMLVKEREENDEI